MLLTLINEIKALINEHIKLIKQDASDSTKKIIKAITAILFALIVGNLGFVILGITIVALMCLHLSAWTALSIGAAIFFTIPVILLIYAFNLFHDVFKTPKQSIQELEKTGEEAQTWLRNIKK